jgi:hypothetical protein
MNNRRNVFDALNSSSEGSIAKDTLFMAEEQYLKGEYDQKELDALEDRDGFTAMAYKDDDGYWRVTGSSRKYLSSDELTQDYPNLM